MQRFTVEVTHMRCGHCDTLITDNSTVVKRESMTFCCNNCATAYARAQESPNEVPTGNGRPTDSPITR